MELENSGSHYLSYGDPGSTNHRSGNEYETERAWLIEQLLKQKA